MFQSNSSRIKALETAVLRAEGAQYALHDLLARALARMTETEFRQLMAGLQAHADQLDEGLGHDRISGYRDELASIAEEVMHARPEHIGILGRLRRT